MVGIRLCAIGTLAENLFRTIGALLVAPLVGVLAMTVFSMPIFMALSVLNEFDYVDPIGIGDVVEQILLSIPATLVIAGIVFFPFSYTVALPLSVILHGLFWLFGWRSLWCYCVGGACIGIVTGIAALAVYAPEDRGITINPFDAAGLIASALAGAGAARVFWRMAVAAATSNFATEREDEHAIAQPQGSNNS